jgi:hypothetical protein
MPELPVVQLILIGYIASGTNIKVGSGRNYVTESCTTKWSGTIWNTRRTLTRFRIGPCRNGSIYGVIKTR